MSVDYKTCAETGTSEITEKKSRFLGELSHVETLSEAEKRIAEIRRTYYDARHHCFAYVCGEPGSADEIVRSSDDGEPQGTAGKPMLEILTGAGLHKSLVVVTRYFGGTLLGTGGLVRAYSSAAREALRSARIVTVRQGVRFSVRCSYSLYGKIQNLLSGEHVRILHSDFTDEVQLEIVVPVSEEPRILHLITDSSAGQAVCENLGTCTFT